MTKTKIKKIEHDLVRAWAQQHYALQASIDREVAKMNDDEVQALRHATSSLTETNCWYAEYDVRPLIEEALGRRQFADKIKRDNARHDAASGEQPKEGK